jgi:hypothetical protein
VAVFGKEFGRGCYPLILPGLAGKAYVGCEQLSYFWDK